MEMMRLGMGTFDRSTTQRTSPMPLPWGAPRNADGCARAECNLDQRIGAHGGSEAAHASRQCTMASVSGTSSVTLLRFALFETVSYWLFALFFTVVRFSSDPLETVGFPFRG